MRHKKLKFSVLIFLLGIGLTGLQAQESINTTGGNASGSGGSVSYSVGQVSYQTHTGTNGSVAEGAQQPYEISIVTGINDAKGINLSVTAYPNPTTDYLILSVDASTTLSIQSLSYQLYDINGRLLQNGQITSKQTSIVMSNLRPATYFVKVIHGSNKIGAKQFNEVKTFKIIKH